MWKSNMEPSNKCNSQVEPATCCSGRFVVQLFAICQFLRFCYNFWGGFCVGEVLPFVWRFFPGLKIERAGLKI